MTIFTLTYSTFLTKTKPIRLFKIEHWRLLTDLLVRCFIVTIMALSLKFLKISLDVSSSLTTTSTNYELLLYTVV